MTYNYQEHEDRINAFEILWRDWFSTYPPMDKMTFEEREEFKSLARKIYCTGRNSMRSSNNW